MLGGSLYGDLREYPGSWTYDDSTLTRISVAHTNDLHATFPPPRIGLLSVFVVKGYSWHTLSPLLRTTGMSNPSGGNPSGKRFPPPGKFWTQPKIVARPAQLRKKTLPLSSWRPLDYKPHIECTSPSRSKIQYICALPLSK